MIEEALRIAMMAPPFYEISPTGDGGIEAVVAQVVDGLVDRGHDVTLLAAAGSQTVTASPGRLVPTWAGARCRP